MRIYQCMDCQRVGQVCEVSASYAARYPPRYCPMNGGQECNWVLANAKEGSP